MMKFHHIGIAVKNIEKELQNYKNILDVKQVGEIVYDSIQCARLCMLELGDGVRLELVEGLPVEKYLKKGIQMYHICYEVTEMEKEIAKLEKNHSVMVSPPSPAVLFYGKRVAFMYTSIGLIELLEA